MKILSLILLQFLGFKENILKQLSDFQMSKEIKSGTVVFNLSDCQTGENIISFNSNKLINPASTLKLVTTATVLNQLGSDFRFTTDLYYTGVIENNELIGDLLIQPSGDPSFGSIRTGNDMDNIVSDMIAAIKELNISKIKGNVIVNDSDFFKYDIPDSWIWGDMGNYYGAVHQKFNINENQFTVYFKSGLHENDPVEINSLSPFDPSWKITNLVKTGPPKSGDQVYIYSSPLSNDILMKGTIPLGSSNFGVKGSIPMPAKFFKSYLINALNISGISCENISTNPSQEKDNDFQNPTLIRRYLSSPLSEMIAQCNYNSINIYADSFLKAAFGKSNQYSNFDLNGSFLKKYWENSGVNLDGFQIKDGSGLAMSDLITAENMTSILNKMSDSEVFFKSIPVLGQDGTVRNLDKQKISKGRIRAKSGTIEGSRTYAGFISGKNDKKWAYMIGVNRFEKGFEKSVSTFMENILLKLIDLDQ